MSVINSQPLIGASGNQGGAYNLTRSLRFRSSASAYLNRTPAGAGNRQIATFSWWMKRGSVAADQAVFSLGAYPTNLFEILFLSNNTLYISNTPNSTTNDFLLQTTQVFRDPSAWYHFVLSIDTTQATSSNRAKLYVNGTQVTSFSSATYPSQNTNLNMNTAVATQIGRRADGNYYQDAYLAETYFIDGQALTPSSFGETSTTTGVWIPKAYTGTYGTNGFYLDFEDTSSVAALGYDAAGSNDWTVNNVSLTAGTTYDSMTDVPTLTSATAANYCVMNPNYVISGFLKPTISNGNLTLAPVASDSYTQTTFAVPRTGKYYWEVTFQSASSLLTTTGLGTAANTNTSVYVSNGQVYALGVLQGSTVNAWSNGDVIGMAVNMDANTLALYRNNTLQTTITAYSGTADVFILSYVEANTPGSISYNFGQRPFAYTPPTGFVALNTFNLPTPTIGATASTQANKYMDATLYTGNASARSITNAGGFSPDLVWVKNRTDATTDHKWTDSVRGVTKSLESNTADVEATDTNGLTAFNSNGFSLGSDSSYNANSKAFVGWQWQAGQGSSASNTSGSITSTVSVNATAGFSVVTYTGTGANATVGHGLGVAPKLLFVKNRVGVYNWRAWHTALPGTDYLFLTATDAVATSSTYWNSTVPTSTVFSLGTNAGVNNSGETFVAYCFSEIAGYSKFGNYTGNGSTDGTFVYLGFRPKFVMIKRTDATANWSVRDSVRGTYNVNDYFIRPNTNDEETVADSTFAIDFLSNGFKLRGTWQGQNASGGNLIYAAFAETPFKYANAR